MMNPYNLPPCGGGAVRPLKALMILTNHNADHGTICGVDECVVSEASENLPDPDVIAAEIVEDLRAALEQFEAIEGDLAAPAAG